MTSDTPEKKMRDRAQDPGFWKEIWNQMRLVYYLIRDPDVPFYLKLLPAAALLYVLVPIDIAPDIYPVLGQLDDLTAILVGAKVFIEMAPPHVVARYMSELHGGSAAGEGEQDPLEDKIVVDAEHELVGDKKRKDL
jgi:uncharacterized membrane protein YkvA (DUF1232 family)